MIFPDKLDVLAIHARLIAKTGGTEGVRDEALLESAITAAKNRYHYETADAVSCAATYAFHLTQAMPSWTAISASQPPSLKPFSKRMALN